MRKRVAMALGVLLFTAAIAASGCRGDSDPEAESRRATTTEQVETRPAAQPAGDIAKFRAAFEERFGAPGSEASWYGHVTGLEMADGKLEIATDLGPEDDGDETLRAICLAAINFAFDVEAGDGIETAAVLGSDGAPLGQCA
jgi:hypothetical protein